MHLEAVRAENANISWNTITELDLDHVSSDQLLGVHVQLLTFANHYRKLHSSHCVSASRRSVDHYSNVI